MGTFLKLSIRNNKGDKTFLKDLTYYIYFGNNRLNCKNTQQPAAFTCFENMHFHSGIVFENARGFKIQCVILMKIVLRFKHFIVLK